MTFLRLFINKHQFFSSNLRKYCECQKKKKLNYLCPKKSQYGIFFYYKFKQLNLRNVKKTMIE